MTTSGVRVSGGVPSLFVDGKIMPPMAYITYLPERNRYADFAAAGYRLFSVVVFFGRQSINERSQIHPFADGIFDVKGRPDFSLFDREIERVLEACPDAMIFPRVNTSLPKWWEDENPDELNDTGIGGHRRRPCFSSDKFIADVSDFLGQLVRHVEAMPWRDRVCAYQIAGGNTEEWFSFDQLGSIGLRAREKFAAEGGDPEDAPAFFRYLSRAAVRVITALAHDMKEYTHRRLAIGAFYGYTFELPRRSANHHALTELLRSPDIDFLCSPASYRRFPGCDFANMSVLDSIKLHGKLYFAEYDTRTYLTKKLAQCRENSTEPGTYDSGVWIGPESPHVSRHMLRANFARQLTHGHGSWWFDMWGGWFRDPDIMSDMSKYLDIMRRSLSDADRGFLPELALFIDEKSYAEEESAEAHRVSYVNRIAPGSCGAPYDVFDIADFPAVGQNYRAAVFFVPNPTADMSVCIESWSVAGRPFLVVDRRHPDLTVAALRGLLNAAGAHNWCDTGDAIYVGSHYIGLLAASEGDKLIRLPKAMKITPALPAGKPFVSDSIAYVSEEFETRLFRID